MEYRVLGPLEIGEGNKSLLLGSAKQRALLAFLLLNANRVVSRGRLIDALWGEEPPERAVAAVQVYVSRLRKLLPVGVLLTQAPGYLLRVAPDELDLERFERLRAQGRLHEALALWRGAPLAEFEEPFARTEGGRLDDLRLATLEERIDADLALGRHADVIGELEALIAEHPHRERLRGQLMLALYRSGRQAEALEAYQHARHALVDELGIDPSAALQRLEKQILTQDQELESPPRSQHLPSPASSFVGRELEVEEVVALVRDGARLLTLTGPGGTGKTRLALEAAAELVPEFKAGVFWVGLAPLRESALVSATIAQTIGATTGLAEYIAERELLLLLDNLEHVIDAAPELSTLVEACPNLRLLSTSRELLRVRGEVEYPVPPLAEPEAVELFCTRSGGLPDENAHSLCRALDNLPLALELAAARASVLSPKQILERLSTRLDLLKGGRDADPRQQTLRATIEWSHDLLNEEEGRLFARLSIFAGGCTLEAAEQVADADLDTLQSLADKNLLRYNDERFGMLEMIRAYAAERLEQSGEADQVRRRHALHFLMLAEEAAPHLAGRPKKESLDLLARDHNNLRAALDRLEASGEGELGLRMAGALSNFWYLHGHLAEGRRRLEGALRGEMRASAARAKALLGASMMASAGGDTATGRLRAEQALALNRTLGDAKGIATSGWMLACAAKLEGDFARAQELTEESVRRFREEGDEQMTLLATCLHAILYEDLGDRERARALHEENLRQARTLPNERVEALSLGELAGIAVDEGRVVEALSMLKQSLRILGDLGDLDEMAEALCLFARALAVDGRAETAARLLSSSEALRAKIGGNTTLVSEPRNEETLTTIRAQLDEAALAAAWEQGQALTAAEAVALALAS